jgi:hypothetical protein
MGPTEIHVTSSQSSVVFFFQSCDVAQVAIIHKNIYTNLVTFKIWKYKKKVPFFTLEDTAMCSQETQNSVNVMLEELSVKRTLSFVIDRMRF